MRYGIQTARFRRAFCLEFGAIAPDSYWSATPKQLAAACNGVGPEHWPQWARWILSVLLRPLDASSGPHDWEYSQKAKSYRAFSAANWHLAVNVAREALYDCRPGVIPAGVLAALLCQLFGLRAYKSGRLRP